MRAAARTIDAGAILAAEIRDDTAPTLERNARVLARHLTIINLVVAAVAPAQIDGASRDPYDANARGASREHHHDAGDVFTPGNGGVSADRTERKGHRVHATAQI
jgi:hypothetical protein